MTDILVRRLERGFPSFRGHMMVWVYGANERIHLSLPGSGMNPDVFFYSHEKIEGIARKIFDVPFKYERQGDTGPAVFFEPEEGNPDPYQQNHYGHYIWVKLPFAFPEIEISTHNRGAAILFPKQRNNYFRFVTEVYQAFVLNAKTSKKRH
jgi:hypothetical protein